MPNSQRWPKTIPKSVVSKATKRSRRASVHELHCQRYPVPARSNQEVTVRTPYGSYLEPISLTTLLQAMSGIHSNLASKLEVAKGEIWNIHKSNMIGRALIACGVHTSNISRGIMLSTHTIYYYARKQARYILDEVPKWCHNAPGCHSELTEALWDI